jgi:hypothetical protein
MREQAAQWISFHPSDVTEGLLLLGALVLMTVVAKESLF